MSDLIDYLERRRKSLNEHYSWLASYIKKIEPSPKIEQVLLLCDNFANELTILNNEVNHRLEIVLRRQDETDKMQKRATDAISSLIDVIKTLANRVNELEAIQTDVDAIKIEQQKLSSISQGIEKLVNEKADELNSDIKKSEDRVKRGLPGVG